MKMMRTAVMMKMIAMMKMTMKMYMKTTIKTTIIKTMMTEHIKMEVEDFVLCMEGAI